VPVTTGPEDLPGAEDHDRLRAADTDREQVIGTLQAAFTQARLSHDEFAARAGKALTARTYAELDALVADIPADPAAAPLRGRSVRSRDWRARPLVKAGWLADREYVIDTLKTAFVHGLLTREDLDGRTGQVLTARTYAELDALAADIPGVARLAGPPVPPAPAAAGLARPSAPARRWPLARAAAGAGSCLVIAAAAMAGAVITDPGAPGPNPWATLWVLLLFVAVCAALGFLVHGVATSIEQRRSRRQLPPRPGRGGHAPDSERRGGTGRNPGSPGLSADQSRADVRAHQSREHRQRVPARSGRAPRDVRPAPGAA
jgi:Domain of unknown function (DUF1707)